MSEYDLFGIVVVWCLGVVTGWLLRDTLRGGTLTISYRGRVFYERKDKQHDARRRGGDGGR